MSATVWIAVPFAPTHTWQMLADEADCPPGFIVVGKLAAGPRRQPRIAEAHAVSLPPVAAIEDQRALSAPDPQQLLARLVSALREIASCATACDCCRTHAREARRALAAIDLSEDKLALAPLEPR